MGPNLVPNSVPCTPAAVELPGPNLFGKSDFKVRSNSTAAETLIDLDDFDPLIRPSAIQTSLETIQSVAHESVDSAETPTTNSFDTFNDLTPTLDANSTSYVLLDKSLQLIQKSGSNFSKEAECLIEFTRQIAFNNKATNSTFCAPSVNYNTTKAESIKLVVFEDKTLVIFIEDLNYF